MVIDVVVRPIVDLGAHPLGARRFVPFDGGTFEARGGVVGTIAPGGTDWQTVRSDGVIEIDAHYVLITSAAESIEVRSTGLRKASAYVAERIAAGRRSSRASTTSGRMFVSRPRRLGWRG